MADNVQNLMLEHLKKIQAEQAASRERDTEIMSRLGNIESGIARISRDEATTYGEVIQDRHKVDKLVERLERIERRLELTPG
jgi:tetrahydromethanopterin S-methyltransferase subunit G